MKYFFLLLIAFAFLLSFESCYYDVEEELYPDSLACDTSNVTYSNDVWPVIESNCVTCHNGNFPSGNVSLADYNDIVAATQNGRLLGVIKHEDGWPEMPKGGGMLPDCDIQKIEIWVNAGTPNN